MEGRGAVLYQKQGGKMRVVGYGSRSLTMAEKNYYLHSGKVEFLALKWAVYQHLREYLCHAPHFHDKDGHLCRSRLFLQLVLP